MSPLPPLGFFAHGAAITGDYQAIMTATVDSGGASSITFSSIPSTFKHLQIRGIIKTSATAGGSTRLIANSDSGTNYSCHILSGNGSSAQAAGFPSETKILTGYGNQDTTYHAPQVIDILDYASVNKYKTFRILSGDDNNGGGNITLASGLWLSTSAISSITMTCQSANFSEFTTFALYGIKAGA